MSTLGDGQVTPDEEKMVRIVSDFIKENPQGGVIQLGIFMRAHPEMQKAIQDAQRGYDEGFALAEGSTTITVPLPPETSSSE